jgi:CRP/FNR family cyclic AMP-dependent transcriptional regulator
MDADIKDHDIIGVISRSPWFENLPGEAHERLAAASRIRSYRKNSYLYTTGEKSTEIFCILSGRVRMLLTSAIGQEYAISDFEPESWLGGEFLAGDNATSLDVQINENTTVLVIPRAAVLEVGERHPQMFRRLFADTMSRLAGLLVLLQGMAFYPLRSRLAGWFLELIEKHGQQNDEGIYLDVHLSQNDFAQLSLGSRQRINKILGEWREQGILDLQSNRYLIRNIEALRAEMELKDTDD